MTELQLQGHKHRRARVLSKWVAIVKYYEQNGAKATIKDMNVSRTHLYYIIKEMNKKAN